MDGRVLPELTTRERQVMAGIAAGKTNREIAGDLCLSGATVRNYASSAFAKLGCANRTQAAIMMRQLYLHPA